MQLASTLLGPDSASRCVVLLHGILGSGGNLRGLGRRLAEQLPGTRIALFDLRGHGDSADYARSVGAPHTVRACVEDVERALRELRLQADFVIGHSFGGKVALMFAQIFPHGVRQAWALDSTPGVKRDRDGGEVGHVYRVLREVPTPFASRDAMLQALESRGIASGIARWMTTNLRRDGDVYEWAFDLDVVSDLLDDYFRQDLWPWLEERRGAPDIHLLRALDSDRFSQDDAQRARALPPQARVTLHELPDSGHWVHADNPEGLLEILRSELSHG
ncbi:MAG: alpha/beta hydrolase [Myxococcales bacterium]|nr:alpha/beta hydrolase [Myxococcales bacterium]